jgi:hypothetical protein
MEIVYALGAILVGIFFLYITYKDEKNREANLTVSYIMHLNGYLGGIGFIVIGLMMILK